jgi:uncharacterized membrane protein YhhN
MVLLVGVALATARDHPGSGFVATVAVVALAFSLLGDVFLLDDRFFVPELAAFLFAHVAYVVGFVRLRYPGSSYALSFVVTGVVLAAAAFLTIGLRIVRGASAEDPALRVPVLAYLTVICVMLVTAWWTGDLRIIPGALLFVLSDSLIGWTKFVRKDWQLDVPIIVTYHLAQLLLVFGMLRK